MFLKVTKVTFPFWTNSQKIFTHTHAKSNGAVPVDVCTNAAHALTFR